MAKKTASAQIPPREVHRRQQPSLESLVARLAPARRAAAELGVPYTTLRDAVFRGDLPVVKLGRAWYFDRLDLTKFVDRQKETF